MAPTFWLLCGIVLESASDWQKNALKKRSAPLGRCVCVCVRLQNRTALEIAEMLNYNKNRKPICFAGKERSA